MTEDGSGEAAPARVDAPAAPPVAVTGMHRSGTSLVARLVRDLGWYLGADHELLVPQPDNPAGYFERRDVYEADDAVLEALGASWDAPPPPDEVEAAADGHAGRVSALLDGLRAAAGERPYAVKDPRLCVLWPVWGRALPDDVQVVLCRRHPVEVARSLEARDGIPVVAGLALWEEHTTRLLAARRGRSLVVVRYADVLHDPQAAFDRLADALGAPARPVPGGAVRADLRRNRAATADAALLTAHQRALVAWLDGLPDRVDALDVPDGFAEPSPATARIVAGRRVAAREARARRRDADALDVRLRAALAQVHEGAETAERARREAYALQAQLHRREVELGTSRQDAADLLRRLGEVQRQVEEGRDALAAAARGTEDVAAERDGLAARADALAAERDGLAERADALAAERDGLARRLSSVSAERDDLAELTEQLRTRRRAQTDELAGLRAARQRDAAEARAEVERLRARCDELAGTAARLSGELEAVSTSRRVVAFERANLGALVASVEWQRRSLEVRLQGVLASRAWRIGRALTAPFRWFGRRRAEGPAGPGGTEAPALPAPQVTAGSGA